LVQTTRQVTSRARGAGLRGRPHPPGEIVVRFQDSGPFLVGLGLVVLRRLEEDTRELPVTSTPQALEQPLGHVQLAFR
jgi:hypothetical protein